MSHILMRENARASTAGAARAYRGWARAQAQSPAQVIAEVTESGLRGRGGAGFPTGSKWGFVRPDAERPPYLLCNADESEPGTFKDHWLLEHDPHLVLEGILIAARAIHAQRAILYMRGEYASLLPIVGQALDDVRRAGLMDEGRSGRERRLDVTVVLGAGAYICGEETGLMESLEGKRAYPRVRPPFPAVRGFAGQPTVVNNVETLANLPWILEHGAAAFRAVGTADSPGTKLVSLSGCIARPGVYEIAMGYPLKDLLEHEGGGSCRGGGYRRWCQGDHRCPS